MILLLTPRKNDPVRVLTGFDSTALEYSGTTTDPAPRGRPVNTQRPAISPIRILHRREILDARRVAKQYRSAFAEARPRHVPHFPIQSSSTAIFSASCFLKER